ncbi:MAG: helix-turn-helix domain-containing protein, partial [Acidimicrobiales bacterium]
MSAAQRIRALRCRAGLTQDELARRAGTSQPAINRYERGRAVPSAATLERIARACGDRRTRPTELLLAHREEVLR